MPEAATLYDPLRRREVAATPEEQVRQWFIGVLASRGVPMHMMMSEVAMKYGRKTWRADIVIWGAGGTPMAVTECKRPGVGVSGEVAAQARRYQSVLGVRFIFLTNGSETYAYRREGASFVPVGHLPDYTEMTQPCQQ